MFGIDTATIVGWVASFVIGLVAKLVTDWRNDQNAKDVGRLEAERNQAIAGLEAKNEMNEIAGRSAALTRDEVVGKLEKGEL